GRAGRPGPRRGRERGPAAAPDPSRQVGWTGLVEGLEPTNVRREGFETTSAGFGEMRLEANEVESLREEVTAEDVRPRADLEPTVPDDAETATESEIDLEPLLDIEIESPAPPPRTTVPRVAPQPPPAPKRAAPAPVAPARPGGGSPPRVTSPKPL